MNSVISRNVVWNVAGTAAPLFVAIIAIPLIIRGLGVDRFGILALAWTVIGYFGGFDLGLGVATTKFVAEFRERGKESELLKLVVTSACLHLALGIVGASIMALLTNWLAMQALNVPPVLRDETRHALYVLALSIPVIVVTACFRGALEGLHRFDVVNAIKVPASIANYVSPLIVLQFTPDLTVIVAVIAATRLAALLVYGWFALRPLPDIAGGTKFDMGVAPSLMRYGGWLSISNFVTPIIVSLDRFLIGAFISAGAVAYYATPYEVITKLWIFSAGLLGVLLPVFSAMTVSGNPHLRPMMRRAVRLLLAAVAIPIGVVFSLGGELLEWWLGEAFRQQSTVVSHWIALGMLFSVVAQVPLTALHGLGRTDVTAKIVFFELIVYANLAYYMALHFGINGIAFAWAIRAIVDAILLFAAGDRLLPRVDGDVVSPKIGTLAVLGLFLASLFILGIELEGLLWKKIIASAFTLAALSVWMWRYLIADEDRGAVRRILTRMQRIVWTRNES